MLTPPNQPAPPNPDPKFAVGGETSSTVVPSLNPAAMQAAEKKRASRAKGTVNLKKVWHDEIKVREAERQDQLAALGILGLQQDIEARGRYASRIFVLIVFWLLSILLILVFQAFEFWTFQLSDNVVLGLIGGTTASVLALFTIVAKYFFPERKAEKKSPLSAKE